MFDGGRLLLIFIRQVEIQDKELQFFLKNFNTLGHQSALLAGFMFGALLHENDEFKGVFANSDAAKVNNNTVADIWQSTNVVASCPRPYFPL